MQSESIQHLEDRLEENEDFNMGSSFARGLDIWKKDAGYFILFSASYLLLTIVISLLPQIGQLLNSLIVGPCMSLGIAIYAYRVHADEERDSSSLFDGFAHWIRIAQYASIMMVIMLIALAPIIYYVLNGIDTSGPIALQESIAALELTNIEKLSCFGSVLIAVIMSVLFGFAPHFIGFYEVDAITALKYSYRFVSRSWIKILIFAIIIGLIAFSGMLLFGIGFFITFSLVFPMQYSAFEDLTTVSVYYDNNPPVSETDIEIS